MKRGRIGNGYWALDVTRAGTYTFEVRRWPAHLDRPIEATRARIKVGELEEETSVSPDDTRATFSLELGPGPTTLQTWLTLPDGRERGAYFVYAERVD